MCLAVPGQITSIEVADPILRSGRVQFGDIERLINLSCVPEAEIGDYVLVHAGLAISTVDEAAAHQVFEDLRRMGELDELSQSQD
jgi:hydrogenase expression/formation protein HypC